MGMAVLALHRLHESRRLVVPPAARSNQAMLLHLHTRWLGYGHPSLLLWSLLLLFLLLWSLLLLLLWFWF
jgi:hypothetical protein